MGYNYNDNPARIAEVGTRVQRDENEQVIGGVIESIDPAQRMRTNNWYSLSEAEQEEMTAYANIKWDNGATSRVAVGLVYFEDTEMERQFRNAATVANKLIREKLTTASQALDEAQKIADQYGVPFNSYISPLSQSYYPYTTHELYGDLDRDFVNDVTGAYHSEYGEEGWQYSAVCY